VHISLKYCLCKFILLVSFSKLLLDGEAKNMNEFRVVMVERNDSQDINTQSIIIDSDKR